MRYCPSCGAEYRAGFDNCADCGVALVDDPSVEFLDDDEPLPQGAPPVVVMTTGRRIDAELARGMLEGNGVEARIWSSGLSPWQMAAALTEATGVPNDFNSYRVVVAEDDVDVARELLDVDEPPGREAAVSEPGGPRTWMDMLRSRWLVTAVFGFVLALVVVNGID